MKGIARHTEAIIGPVSRLDCLNGWVLAGGTALAVQLGHRLSEDLDFMRWQTHKNERMDVDWPVIRRQLETVGEIQSMDILDHNHVEFFVSGVKLSCYARESKATDISPHKFRHSRAMYLLQAGVNLVYIRDILGHVSVQTTEIYARANPDVKAKVLEQAYADVGLSQPQMRSWEENPKLKSYLKGLE